MSKVDVKKLKNTLDRVYKLNNDEFLSSDICLSDTQSCFKVLSRLKKDCDDPQINNSVLEIEKLIRHLYHNDLVSIEKNKRQSNFKQSIEFGKYHAEIRNRK